MATSKLGLPTITGNMSMDVVRDLNALANEIDSKAGAAGGLATLNAGGKLPAIQLEIDFSKLATKDEVTSHSIKKASLTEVGHVQLSSATNSTSEVFAATPKAVKAAYDRADAAFTQANDGKTAVANAVTAKGVPASPADTFPTLASKIGQINTGKKWASGSDNAVWTTSRDLRFTASGLDFTPRYVIVESNVAVRSFNYFSGILYRGVNRFLRAELNTDTNKSGITGHHTTTGGRSYVAIPGGFDIQILEDVSASSTIGRTVAVSWFACE